MLLSPVFASELADRAGAKGTGAGAGEWERQRTVEGAGCRTVDDLTRVLESFGHDRAGPAAPAGRRAGEEEEEVDAQLAFSVARFDDSWHGASKSRTATPPGLSPRQDAGGGEEGGAREEGGGKELPPHFADLPSFAEHVASVARMELLRGGTSEGGAHGRGCPPGCGCNPASDFAAGLAAAFGGTPTKRVRQLATKRTRPPHAGPDAALSPTVLSPTVALSPVGAVARVPSASPSQAQRNRLSGSSATGGGPGGAGARRASAENNNEMWGKALMDSRFGNLPSTLPSTRSGPGAAQEPAGGAAGGAEGGAGGVTPPLHTFGASSNAPVLGICIRGRHVFTADGGEVRALPGPWTLDPALTMDFGPCLDPEL